MKSYAVIGCGNGGKAVAGEIASKGNSVSIFEKMPNDDFRKLQESGKITLTGKINLEAKIDLITDKMADAIEGRDVIVIVVPAFAHENLLQELLPLMRDGQDLVVILRSPFQKQFHYHMHVELLVSMWLKSIRKRRP